MTLRPIEAFEREFREPDGALFAELTAEMIGEPLSRWRESYADGLDLEFGRLLPREPLQAGERTERGEWVVNVWGGDPMLRLPGGKVVDYRQDGFQAVLKHLPDLEHERVTAIRMTVPDLSLEIEFGGGAMFRISTEWDADHPDVDHWFIQTPFHFAIGARGRGTWYCEPNSIGS